MIDNIDNLSHVLASALTNETEMVPNNPPKNDFANNIVPLGQENK